MLVGILGPLEVRVAGGDPVPLGGVRQRALLAILALDANVVVSTDRLIDLLWGESPPATASHTVQVFVSRLRRALGLAGDRLVTRAPGYLLQVGADELDAERCEHQYATAQSELGAGNAARAASLLRDALSLWRGSVLAEFTYEPFAQAAIARFEERRVDCCEVLIEAKLALGRHTEVIPELEALIHEHPLRERPRAQLMLALYRSGRQADALDEFQHARRTLVDELAIEPSPLLRDLEQAILRQDPSLAAPSRPTPSDRAPSSDVTTRTHDHGAGTESRAEPVDAGLATTVRKTATVLVAHLAARAGADPEVERRLIAAGRAEIDQIASHHGGVSMPRPGAGVAVLFGVPLTKEDDALRALRTADQLRAALAEQTAPEPAELVVRIGVDTGEVIADATDDVFGEPLGGAGALALAGQPGEVLLSDATRRMASGAIRVDPALDGKAWRLLALASETPHLGTDVASRMVDRQDELMVARAVFTRTVRGGDAHILIITGDAGIGKSRLAREVIDGLGEEAAVLVGRCLSYGEGIAFWPLREALTLAAAGSSAEAIRKLIDHAPDAELVAEIVAGALGLASTDPAGEQVPWAFRRLLDEFARRRPVVLVIDDAHSAGLPLLKLVNDLVDWLAAPVLILCLGRPELFDSRPDWGIEDPRPDWGKHPRVEVLKLAPLADDDAFELLTDRLGDRRLSDEERDHIVTTADGNPLFVEQLLAMSAEDPWWDGGRGIPATIQSLLAARLDRLGPGERAFIQRAALIGREFWPAAVVELLPAEARGSAPEHLRALVRRGLIQPVRRATGDDEELRFHHILIRDVAYRSTPKALRGELHERFANWLESYGEGYEEIVGYHLAEAFQYRRELERANEDLYALGARAGERLAAAGRRAVSRGDSRAGANLLGRARELFDSGGRARPDVLLEFGTALIETGEFAEAERALTSALDMAQSVNDEAHRARALIELSDLHGVVDVTARADETQRVADEAIAVFKSLGDGAGLARALLHVADVHWTRCHFADMERVLERALKHAERAGARRERSLIVASLARAAVTGPRPVEAAIPRCQIMLERAGDDLMPAVVAEMMLAVLDAMRGEFDDARRRWQTTRARLEEVGRTVTLSSFEMYHAFIELMANAPADVEADLERACAVLERSHERSRLATISALLARVHCAQGHYAEAERCCAVSAEASIADDIVSQAIWRGARARVLVRGGDAASAIDLATTAVSLAEETDFLMLHADALCDRADALVATKQHDAAIADLEGAVTLYKRKGMKPSAATTRALQQSLLAPSL
jgi:DNA-binding SARP family transcriptional activator/tetratricopeptide (TPR) repeat protein